MFYLGIGVQIEENEYMHNNGVLKQPKPISSTTTKTNYYI